MSAKTFGPTDGVHVSELDTDTRKPQFELGIEFNCQKSA